MTTSKTRQFWGSVAVGRTDVCWLWLGWTDDKGYGRFWDGSKNHKAHRVAYELAIGSIPEGKYVCHKCDVPLCCNPEHLFVGNHLDNVQDMLDKKRNVRGEQHGQAVLTDEDVLEICKRYGEGETQTDLAEEYSISRSMISMIVTGKSWKHLKRDVFEKTSGRPTITAEEAKEIKDKLKQGVSRKQLAEEYKVSYWLICNIVYGRAWKDVF